MKSPRRTPMNHPALHGLQARLSLMEGIDRIADLLQPTLGPLGGNVFVSSETGNKSGELLSDGGQIARRVVQISTGKEDMGAMLLRNLAWRMRVDHGGGSATAAVMTRALVRQLLRGIEAGFDPWELSRVMNELAEAASYVLGQTARPVSKRITLVNAIRQSLPEPGAADVLAEALDTLGADAVIRIKQGSSGSVAAAYQEGSFWTLKCASRYLIPGGEIETKLNDARILVTDIPLRSIERLTPALERTVAAGGRSFVVVAPEIGDAVISLLQINQERGVFDRVFAVIAPLATRARDEALEDIATISGARVISSGKSDSLDNVAYDDLGIARLTWGTASTFGIRGGFGLAASRLAAIARLSMEREDADAGRRRQIDKRIGNLAGAVVEIQAPAGPESAHTELSKRIESSIATGRSLLEQGAVVGGGMAYINAIPSRPSQCSPVSAFCLDALTKMLSEPLRVIVVNAGISPAHVIAQHPAHPYDAFDVRTGQWVDPWESGIVDSTAICASVIRESVATALQAISIEVLVARKSPPFSELP